MFFLDVHFGYSLLVFILGVHFGCSYWVFILGVHFVCSFWVFIQSVHVLCSFWVFNAGVFILDVHSDCSLRVFILGVHLGVHSECSSWVFIQVLYISGHHLGSSFQVIIPDLHSRSRGLHSGPAAATNPRDNIVSHTFHDEIYYLLTVIISILRYVICALVLLVMIYASVFSFTCYPDCHIYVSRARLICGISHR